MRIIARDRGFSLAELLVVIGLLGFVLAGAWAGFSVINKGQEVSDAAAVSARDLSNPMEQMSRMLMQNTQVLPDAGPYEIRVVSNRRETSLPELDRFSVNSAGELIWESWQNYRSSEPTSAYTDYRRWVMSEHNANLAQGVPLFEYYAQRTGATDTPVAGELIPSDCRSVMVTVCVIDDSGQLTQDVRRVFFRNRN